MPMPAGFVQEEVFTAPIQRSSLAPEGFVQESSPSQEIKRSPEPGMFEKVVGFFKDPEKQNARAANVYALSEATGLPIQETNKNYESLRRSTQVMGFKTEPSNREYMQGLMLPGVVAGAMVNPIGTAMGLIAFGVLDKAIPTDKLIDSMEEKGFKDEAVKAVELADFIGKGLLTGGVFKKSGKISEMFLKKKITQYKLPEKLTLTSEQVRDIWQTEKLTTPDQKSLFASLELNSYDRRAALEHGININVPSEKIVKIVDNPLWSKVKNMFGVEPAEAMVSKTTAGQPSKAPRALVEGATISKDGVINNIVPEPTQKIDPVQKVVAALKEAKSVRSKQETLYAEERSRKFAKLQAVRGTAQGEKGFYKELGALKGELPKLEFEAIRGKVGQEDIDSLFQTVRESPKIGEWEKLGAMHGLGKMFGEFGGKVPTENEIKLLGDVFGEELTSALLEKRTLFEKMKQMGLEIANVPRSIMASFDLSAPLRQGLFFIGRPKQFLPAFQKMFGAFINEGKYEDLQDAIITHPDYQLARESGLSLTDMDVMLGSREESFMSSYAERIPLLGKGIKASERAYIGFLNKLRFDVFADLVNKADSLDLDPRKNRDLTKAIADFINNATGRGTLPGSLSKASVALNSIFFSPRLIMSRLNLLNPLYYVKQDPFVRKEALKSLFTFVGVGVTVLSLAKILEADVGTEPRSSDFGKIKIGNTRIDVWGGFQPLVRAAAQLISGKYVSSVTGKEVTLGEGYRPLTRADILQRVVEGKLAPIPSFITALLHQKTPTGEDVSIPKEIAERFTPMVLRDAYDLAKEDPKMLPASVLAVFGIGVQTYEDRSKKAPF